MFNSDDSLYIDKAISNLICELYFFPKFKEKTQLLKLQTKSSEKLVLSEIIDEYINKKKIINTEDVYDIRHILDYSLAYCMTDEEIISALDKFQTAGVILKYSFNHRTTNLPGFISKLNPDFFQ